jgi:hypothetical protein
VTQVRDGSSDTGLTACRIIGADRDLLDFPFLYPFTFANPPRSLAIVRLVMLRSSIAPGRQLLSAPVRQRIPSQWLSKAGASSRLSGQVRRTIAHVPTYSQLTLIPTQRFFADSKPPISGGPTPATPSSGSSVPPETIPKPTEQGTAGLCIDILVLGPSANPIIQNPRFPRLLLRLRLPRPAVSADSFCT